MASDNDSNVTTLMVQPTPVGAVDFLKYRSEFAPLLKTLNKASTGAVSTLERIMAETDDPKLKMSCASKLLEFYISVADKSQQEHLQRLVASARLSGGGVTKQLVNADEQDKPRRPVVDFGTIKEI